ncbi:MAG: hypothetical protein A2284_09470 [Deltaproteobacteria bacterium RIFOXYA12_FULL_61_11]|nr:MAG: hypothetical protein A2284_09470 [Deltaproteobacteria bacterium RIFOXYA12_FULL_61_11]
MKIIGAITTCTSAEHKYLKGYKVKIVGVIKNAARADYDPDKDDRILRSDEALKSAGGLTADDRVEVQPFLEKEGRFSFVSSDPKAVELANFRKLRG